MYVIENINRMTQMKLCVAAWNAARRNLKEDNFWFCDFPGSGQLSVLVDWYSGG